MLFSIFMTSVRRIVLPLCAHILYFNAARFSIELFSFICFTVSVVRKRDEYEILSEMLSLTRC